MLHNEYIGNLVLPDRIIYGGRIICEDGIITQIQQTDVRDSSAYPYILPGLIDIHNHGALGYDYMDCTDESFDVISRYLVEHGVTTAQCTTVSAEKKDILHFIETFREWKKQSNNDANRCRFSGIHLEGPFLAPASRGAHPLEVLRTPEDGYHWVLEHADVVKEMTLAPELSGMPNMIQELTKVGIVVSGGHDKAELEDIINAVGSGMSHCTHIYCAMSTLHKTDAQRKCGLCEYAMTHQDVTAEMIADNHHVPPLLAQMIYKCKGPDHLCVVSDAISPAGLPESDSLYLLGTGDNATKVFVEDGVALVEDKSCYAGSVQALDQMVANLVKDCNISLVDAVRMASLTPAEVIGIDNEYGSICVGKKADLCFMDKDLSVLQTVISGKISYKKQ